MKHCTILLLSMSILIWFTSCDPQKKIGTSSTTLQADIDSLGSFAAARLREKGLMVEMDKQLVIANTARSFGDLIIPIQVYGHLNGDNAIKLDSIITKYKDRIHNLRVNDLAYSTYEDIISMQDTSDMHIAFDDYNFDGSPDLIVHNLSGGMKNQKTDKYLYLPSLKAFLYNPILSDWTNCKSDTEKEHIQCINYGGHASKIYTSTTFVWEYGKLLQNRKVEQDYDEGLQQYIRQQYVLGLETWYTKIDTLLPENAEEWLY